MTEIKRERVGVSESEREWHARGQIRKSEAQDEKNATKRSLQF